MKTDIQVLQDEITPDAMGIIWITEGILYDRPRPFSELDYFLDGLLTNFYNQQKEAKQRGQENIIENKNFFVTRNFGSPFFVGHLKDTSSSSLIKNIDELIGLSNAFSERRKVILILDLTKKSLSLNLNKKYKQFDFKEISLS